VGGQNRIAAKVAGRQEIQGITRWLISQVNKLPIQWHLGTEATPELVLAEAPDAVVIATGSRPKENPFPGNYAAPQVVNTQQILDGEVEAGDKVLFIDLNGHHQGTGTAEWLADHGKKVHVLTPALFQGSALGPLQDLFLTRQRLAEKGVTCTSDIAVLEINGATVKGLNVYSNEMFEYEGYDTIVLAAGNVTEDGLYFQLKGRIEALYRIGDCVAPRLTDMAIVEGHRVGREI
jgi:pyruvate/2-oxoglutarate dehydrogenase complex dihydrolipoamide dehydrogenase (E3) component